jgi:hypothetical protein
MPNAYKEKETTDKKADALDFYIELGRKYTSDP